MIDCIVVARGRASLRLLVVLLAISPWLSFNSTADEVVPHDQWVGEDGLDGDAIYGLMLDNRFRQSVQQLSLSSKDRGNRRQFVEMETKYLRDDDEDDVVVSRSIAKYLRPLDVRNMAYLIVNKRSGPDDQFVYQPSSKRVRRINARTEAIAGTDFTLEDVIPQEADDGDHFRLPDTDHAGTPAWDVAVVPHAETKSSYSKFVITIEKKRAIPLQTDYWDDRGVKIKQLRVDPRAIELFDIEEGGQTRKIWIVRRSKMVHLKRESQTVLNVLHFDPNPDLSIRDFSERKLISAN